MQGDAPVGRARVFEQGDRLWASVAYDDTEDGATACAVVAETRPMWSVGYVVTRSRAPTSRERARGAKRVIERWRVMEVSPVEQPAGSGTGTMEACCEGACAAALGKCAACATERAHIAQAAATEFARFTALMTKLRAPWIEVPPPPERTWRRPLEWAIDQVCLGPSRMPAVKFYLPRPRSWWDDGRFGCYDPETKTVFIRHGLPQAELLRTIFHELQHHRDALRGCPTSETFAHRRELELLTAWEQETMTS
jgi:hypothetical protein